MSILRFLSMLILVLFFVYAGTIFAKKTHTHQSTSFPIFRLWVL